MSISKQKLIVIGNGMASIRFLENMLEKDNCPYDITVFGSEPHGGYNRILLSPLLSGERTLDDIVTHPIEWYEKNQIELKIGTEIIAIDRRQQHVTDNNGENYSYDKLIIATGSDPFIPPIPGRELNGVYSYRTINDVDMMLNNHGSESKAIVIGGGLLGLEAAYGLKNRGMDVTVLHLAPILMENQLDEAASDLLIKLLECKGISIEIEANTKHIHGTEQVESIELHDGRIIPADLVVIAVGIKPNTELAKKTGLNCERGILVNDHLQTSDANIFAIGECVQHRDITYGLVAPLYEQAAICSDYIYGNHTIKYKGSITATGLKVTGVNLFSAGQFIEDNECKTVKLFDDKKSIYRKLIIKNNMLIGALLFGDIEGSLWYQQLIEEKTDISAFKNFIMFGPDYCSEKSKSDVKSLAA